MIPLHGADWIGYLAALLVFGSFYAKTVVSMRLVAITSNVAFIGYGFATGVYPVLILHIVLLPLNCFRLAQLGAMAKRLKRAVKGGAPSDLLIPVMARVEFRKGHARPTLQLYRQGLDVSLAVDQRVKPPPTPVLDRLERASARCDRPATPPDPEERDVSDRSAASRGRALGT